MKTSIFCELEMDVSMILLQIPTAWLLNYLAVENEIPPYVSTLRMVSLCVPNYHTPVFTWFYLDGLVRIVDRSSHCAGKQYQTETIDFCPFMDTPGEGTNSCRSPDRRISTVVNWLSPLPSIMSCPWKSHLSAPKRVSLRIGCSDSASRNPPSYTFFY